MERRTGTVFPPGRDEKVRVMRLTLGSLSRRRCLLAQVSRVDAVCATKRDHIVVLTPSLLSPSFYVLIALPRTDKVHVHHRPLAAYLFTESVNAICELDYKRRGMERLRFGAVECAATASLPSASPT
jgi:hypothetical protein